MTFIARGKGSDAKIIKISLLPEEGDDELHVLTERQCMALATLADYLRWKTRYLSLPEDFQEQSFLNDYADDVQKRLIMTLDFCAKMIECIQNDEDVKDALRSYMLDLFNNDPDFVNSNQGSGGDGQGKQLTEKELNQDIGGLNPACNQDKAFGFLTKFVDDAFQRVYDLFEKIELVTDNQEMIVEYLDLIPGIGLIADEIVIEDAVSFFDSVRSWMNEAFAAEDTLEYREQIVCDLFCIYQTGCKISISQVYQYFKDRIEAETSFGNFFGTAVSIFNFLNNNPTSFGAGIVLVMLGAEFGFGTALNDFFGVHFGKIKLNTHGSTPSDGWEDCDDCGETPWCHRVNWNEFDQYLTIVHGIKDGTKLKSEIYPDFGDYLFGMSAVWDLPFDHNITRIYIHQSSGTNIEGKTVVNEYYALTDVSISILDTNALPQQNGIWTSDDDTLTATTTRHINFEYLYRPASSVLESLTAMEWDYFVICGTGRSVFANNYTFPE